MGRKSERRLTSVERNRGEGHADPLQGSSDALCVVVTQQGVSVDYCLKWNNASQKVIIATLISSYRQAINAMKARIADPCSKHG
jgi:hypothetical protein